MGNARRAPQARCLICAGKQNAVERVWEDFCPNKHQFHLKVFSKGNTATCIGEMSNNRKINFKRYIKQSQHGPFH